MKPEDLIRSYFAAEEAGDVEAVVALCDPAVVVRNAAQPPVDGLDGVRRFVTDFRNRTSMRRFTLLAIAAQGDLAFAWWDAALTFVPGARFGDVTTQRAFDARVQGILRIVLKQGRIRRLDIFHETTSTMIAARNAAAH
jgi:ketosteroid isomerase-like protein